MYEVDYSIEYCHIYSNETVGPLHAESIDLLCHLKEKLTKEGLSFNLCVMLDNYTYPERIFDKNLFLSYLKTRDAVPDIFIDEGDLIAAADELIDVMKPYRARKLKTYIEKKRYPCSLFIAAWYMARLGKLQHTPNGINSVAHHLINILPQHFEPFEKEGFDIIADTPFKNELANIENIYLPGTAYPE